MSKSVFDDISAGLRDAIAYAEGRGDGTAFRVHVPREINVRSIRKRTGLSQEGFSRTYGFAVQTLRDWEQGRSRPDTAVRAYLLVISREPTLVRNALQVAHDESNTRRRA